MNLAQITILAELLAAAGVVASLIFVAFEIRRNTAQARLGNWQSVTERATALWSRTSDIELANLIAKGRKSYHDLTEGEKISFGHYLEELCIAYESLPMLAKSQLHGSEDILALFKRHMQFHLGFPGAREWLQEFEDQRGFPPMLRRLIHEAIDQNARVGK